MNVSTLRTVQRLARMGDTQRAWQVFEASGLAEIDDRPEILCLKGRLLKDQALKASGPKRSEFFERAHAAYLSASVLKPATYPLINAATIALLAGNREAAQATAETTLAMLDSGAHEPETEYWLQATRAEAYLLQGKDKAAQAALAEAVRLAPAAWEDHASTLRHFRLIIDSLGMSSQWLDKLRPPSSLHFSGAIHLEPDHSDVEESIGKTLERLAPGFGFGALAAGSDIITAEMLVRSGAELHIVLPASIAAFRKDSVGRFGTHWISRFDRLLDVAASVETLPDLDEVSEAGILLADQIAMGLAIRQARVLETRACALRIGSAETDQTGVRELDIAWERQGLALERLQAGRVAHEGLRIPAFSSEAVLSLPVSAAVDDLIAQGGERPRRRGTSVSVVFPGAEAAARAALDVAASHDVAIGLDYVAFDPETAGMERFDVAHLIANASAPGAVLLSGTAALALELAAPDLPCETLGNIATAHGDIALSILARN